MNLVGEAYALTTAYMKVFPSSKALYVHISKCPVVDIGDSDGEESQVSKGKRCLSRTAYGEC